MAKGSRLVVASSDPQPQVEVTYKKTPKDKEETSTYDLDVLTEVRGWKAMGNKLSNYKVLRVKMLAQTRERHRTVDSSPFLRNQGGAGKRKD
jgi:topoisomerase-4 subunit A